MARSFTAGGPAIDWPSLPADAPRFQRVMLRGYYDSEHQFLLDNISHEGKPGYQVLTVLRLADGSGLLVNRGWLPFAGYRDRLPDIAFAAPESLRLTGRLSTLPVPAWPRDDRHQR